LKPNLKLGDTALILDVCRQYNVLRNQAAYILATAYWETARSMRPVREYGGEKYLRSKRYYPYVGMGYVQLTWRDNYEFASKQLGVDFVANPRKLLDPQYAAEILVRGMMHGWFVRTGAGKFVHPLTRYVTLQKSDYRNARRGVNGVDKRDEIAAIAEAYEAELIRIGYDIPEAPKAPVEPIKTPEAPTAPETPEATPAAPQPLLTRILSAVLAAIVAALRK
jgi:hypothetical protein